MSYDFNVSIAACRVNAGLTQKAFADRLGVSNCTVINWESGKTSPSASQLKSISELTNIPMDLIRLP